MQLDASTIRYNTLHYNTARTGIYQPICPIRTAPTYRCFCACFYFYKASNLLHLNLEPPPPLPPLFISSDSFSSATHRSHLLPFADQVGTSPNRVSFRAGQFFRDTYLCNLRYQSTIPILDLYRRSPSSTTITLTSRFHVESRVFIFRRPTPSSSSPHLLLRIHPARAATERTSHTCPEALPEETR